MVSSGKGQAAFEYMVIVVIVMMFIIPLWYYGMQTRQGVSGDLSISYAKNTAMKITQTADLLYSQRENASIRIMIHIPDGVQYTNIANRSVLIVVATPSGNVTVLEQSKANITGTIPTVKGDYYYMMRAMGDYVNITAS
ncbi:MAG: hypothetical protein JW716_04990 [Candidatus Aenigmarchaeota archaeon]|nr:hypothetical protein [Candidatus Aenigmarchaeota archaeon]